MKIKNKYMKIIIYIIMFLFTSFFMALFLYFDIYNFNNPRFFGNNYININTNRKRKVKVRRNIKKNRKK
jgi:hypothetical protein